MKPLRLSLALALTTLSVQALADGIPDDSNALSYSGTLYENNRPVSGTRSIRVRIFSAQTGGGVLCDSNYPSAQVTNGNFRLSLAAGCVTAIRTSPTVWAEVSVGGNQISMNRVSAAPYAVEASRAAQAQDAAAMSPLDTRIQTLETGLAAFERAIIVYPRTIPQRSFSTGVHREQFPLYLTGHYARCHPIGLELPDFSVSPIVSGLEPLATCPHDATGSTVTSQATFLRQQNTGNYYVNMCFSAVSAVTMPPSVVGVVLSCPR